MSDTEWPQWSKYRPLRSSWPTSHLLGGFDYTNSAATDIAKTIRRERERIERERRERALREAHERE